MQFTRVPKRAANALSRAGLGPSYSARVSLHRSSLFFTLSLFFFRIGVEEMIFLPTIITSFFNAQIFQRKIQPKSLNKNSGYQETMKRGTCDFKFKTRLSLKQTS